MFIKILSSSVKPIILRTSNSQKFKHQILVYLVIMETVAAGTLLYYQFYFYGKFQSTDARLTCHMLFIMLNFCES